jgi:glutathione S-transferase
MKYRSLEEIKSVPGLRIVIVKGMPSPWSQAARTIFKHKQLDYLTAGQNPGEENSDLVEWCGQNSGPIVAYNDEPPINRWMDILLLSERLAPEPSVLPENAEERVQVIGLTHEVSGDRGIGWWSRVACFHPGMSGPEPPPPMVAMSQKWGYTNAGGSQAPKEIATRLRLLTDQLARNKARGSRYFVGDHVTALDIHWAAMSVLIDPLPEADMPTLPGYYPIFLVCQRIPEIKDATHASLIDHRNDIFEHYFTMPFDYSEA